MLQVAIASVVYTQQYYAASQVVPSGASSPFQAL